MDVKWKSDKTCIECKREYRKEIIGEMKEVCSKCPKLHKLDQEPRHKIAKKKKGRWK